MLDNFLLHFNPPKIHKLRSRETERFAVGSVGNTTLLFGLLSRLLRLLKFHHRNLSLFLNDSLGGLLHHTLRRKDTADDDAVQPHRDVLLFDQFGLHFSRDGLLKFGSSRRIGGQLEERKLLHLFTHERTEGLLHVIVVPLRTIPCDQFR